MLDTRTTKRTYNSFRHEEGLRQARTVIAQAALQLFNQRGCRESSIDAIAEEAEVARETFFATFGSKREILLYLIDIFVSGDEAPVKIIHRSEQQAVLQETDANRLAAGFSMGRVGYADWLQDSPGRLLLPDEEKS